MSSSPPVARAYQDKIRVPFRSRLWHTFSVVLRFLPHAHNPETKVLSYFCWIYFCVFRLPSKEVLTFFTDAFLKKPCKISYSRFGDSLNCFSLGNSIRWSQKNGGIWMWSVIGKNRNKSSIRLDTSSSNHQFAVLVLIDWSYIIQVFINGIAN